MKILVIDFSGHPFQVQLSRALARSGHDVLHLFTGSSETPKGDLVRGASDPATFDVRAVSLDVPFDKTNFVRRFRHERAIGRMFAEVVREYRPDLVIASNCPIETLRLVVRAKDAVGARFIYWLQDLLGEAASRVLSKKLGLPGKLVGAYFQAMERRLLQQADHIVPIANDFLPILQESYGIDPRRVTVIENWSPIDDIPLLPRDNSWAVENFPPHRFRVVYSGTLGYKQDPAVLLELAAQVDCQVLVFSEGVVARQLAADAAGREIDNLEVRPWLPFSQLPAALAAADLLVVLLEPDAGRFSVPSKVLTYLCAGRPILGSINSDNLAARIIEQAGAGQTAAPGDHAALVAIARGFSEDAEHARLAGAAGRRYAEATFKIETIAARFLAIIDQIQARRN